MPSLPTQIILNPHPRPIISKQHPCSICNTAALSLSALSCPSCHLMRTIETNTTLRYLTSKFMYAIVCFQNQCSDLNPMGARKQHSTGPDQHVTLDRHCWQQKFQRHDVGAPAGRLPIAIVRGCGDERIVGRARLTARGWGRRRKRANETIRIEEKQGPALPLIMVPNVRVDNIRKPVLWPT